MSKLLMKIIYNNLGCMNIDLGSGKPIKYKLIYYVKQGIWNIAQQEHKKLIIPDDVCRNVFL